MTDIGLQLVDSLFKQLMVDDEWAVRRERGFTWWAYRLAQHVEIGPPVWSEDRYICSVRIWTDVVRDVDPATEPASVLGVVNAQATVNALVWDDATATITECCTAVIHEEIFAWMSKVLSTAAVLQNAAAHSRAHALAAACGGVPAASNHPSSGERPEMDDLLNFPNVIAHEGRQPSWFAGPGMEQMNRFFTDLGVAGSADSTGLTCEIPFTGRTPAAVITAASQLQTALLQIFTDAPHPEFGNGALVVMKLPLSIEPGQVALVANEMNHVEAHGTSGTALFGAWCPDPASKTTLAFCSFVPNTLARKTSPQNLVIYQGSRSRFAAEQLIG
ncbi:conserved hypothetical protein [Mycolicibacter sinensis]|uniref:Uncharacterized protein n=1 Tax=Mycolicibacter sinensis (strain JDM601) TaxID=875328 RepID=F5Z2K5_MYCSD|nr:hypothetical protein [Mycolicibacter sinensis]AEF34617.1 conserved hypothetical protein [Mycolicibacter sinensis]